MFLKKPNVKVGKTIFSRLIIAFLIIMIPVYILGIYIYQWGLETVKNEISKSTIEQVSFYIEGLEKEIERIKILQYDCLNDEELNKLAIRSHVMSTYDEINAIKHLHQRLVTIKNSSNYIKEVSIHIYPINKTITANSGANELDLEKYENIRVPTFYKGAQIISYKNELYLSTLKYDETKYQKDPYLIEIEIDKNSLKEDFKQFETYKGSGAFVLNLYNEEIITYNESSFDELIKQQIINSYDNEITSSIEYYSNDEIKYSVIYAKSSYLNMVMFRYIPQKYILEPIKNFYLWVWIFSFVAICIIFIYSFFTYKLIRKPLAELVSAFSKVEDGNLRIHIEHKNDDEFGYLYKRFNYMIKNLDMLINQVYNQKILMQKAELKHLQTQISPHFLYNSFFMINTMAKIGDENLVKFTKYLGEYFRFITRSSSDFVPLNEEIKHTKVYLNIQQIRFADKLKIDFEECPEEYRKINVPRLILQPIVENSFKHGLIGKRNDGIIKISFINKDDELKIVVEDNGDKINDTKIKELKDLLNNKKNNKQITGILNIHKRIKLIFGDDSGISLSESSLGGLKTTINLRVERRSSNV